MVAFTVLNIILMELWLVWLFQGRGQEYKGTRMSVDIDKGLPFSSSATSCFVIYFVSAKDGFVTVFPGLTAGVPERRATLENPGGTDRFTVIYRLIRLSAEFPVKPAHSTTHKSIKTKQYINTKI